MSKNVLDINDLFITIKMHNTIVSAKVYYCTY